MSDMPKGITILGSFYKIEYYDDPLNVDMYHRNVLWGQVDHWTCTIRIYDNNSSFADIWHRIFHEVLHVFGEKLKLDCFDRGDGTDEAKHDELDLVALALVDTLFRNDLLKLKEGD